MNSDELRQLAKDYLVPFFSGTEILANLEASSSQQTPVARIDPCTIGFKINQRDTERLHLRRSQQFASQNKGEMTELDIVEAFVDVVRSIETGLSMSYRDDLLASLDRRVVGKAFVEPTLEPIFLKTLDQISVWASRLYEGQPITTAIGFVANDNSTSVLLAEVWKHDFATVMTNGHDTILTANHQGNVLGHESLSMPSKPPSFAPYRLGPIAEWAQGGKLAVVLNRTGEILLLRDKRLVFARRSGVWHFLTPDAVITQIGRPANKNVRVAVLETAIDVSFARSGGCIGVVLSNQAHKWKDVVVDPNDYLDPALSAKAKLISSSINGKKFYELDRRLRQEIVAIDGATLMDHNGTILAAGAILKIPGGSSGGGRLAAAKALSTLGVGIKVSQDGGIRCFHDGNDAPKVALM